MILLIVLGVFAWGCVVGAILCFLCFARYARDLQERVKALEQPTANGGLVSIRYDPFAQPVTQLSRETLMEIVDAMEADDEFDEAAPKVTH